MNKNALGEVIPSSRLIAKQVTKMDNPEYTTIENFLNQLIDDQAISIDDKHIILEALKPVMELVPIVERWIVEMVRSEMEDISAPDYDADSPSNVPRNRELSDWKKSLVNRESLLPLPEFDFEATRARFLVTLETDPQRRVRPLNKLAQETWKNETYVPFQHLLSEKFFLFCLRILRFQYRIGTSLETLMENVRTH